MSHAKPGEKRLADPCSMAGKAIFRPPTGSITLEGGLAMPNREASLYNDDFLAELGLLKCGLCGTVGKEADYRLVPIDEPGGLDWVCLGCLEHS